jgi:predicted ATPase
VRGLSPGQIIARLDDRFRLLTGGSRTASLRHQTLLGAIEWSYDLLADDERVLFRRLSVFAGGWSLEAAETVCSGNGIQNEAVLALLLQLVDKSLVLADDRTVEGAGTSEVRYRLLESLPQYGAQLLSEAEEETGVRARHRVWCLNLAEVSGPKLRGPGGVDRIIRLEADHDNLRAALRWSTLLRAEQSIGFVSLRLASTLRDFWWIHGHLSEGRRWLEAALSKSRCGGDNSRLIRAQAIIGAGVLAGGRREYERAVALLV